MKKRALLPITKAKTMLGVMRDIKNALRSQPARADMRVVAIPAENRDWRYSLQAPPPCGMVGCFGGWLALLILGREAGVTLGMAEIMLGPNVDLHFERKGLRYHVFNSGNGDACAGTVSGTPEHAEAVCARIDKFVARNRRALGRRTVKAARAAVRAQELIGPHFKIVR